MPHQSADWFAMTAFIEMHCKNDTELVPNGLSITAQLAHALPAGAPGKKTCRKNAARLLERGLGRIELAAEDAEQETSGDGGADNTGHVGAHSVHQQEVGGVGLLALLVGHTGSHGHGGHAGRAD